MVEFAIKGTQFPEQSKPSDLEPLRSVGLDDRAILDLTHVIGFFAYANRLVDLLGVPLEQNMTKIPPWA